MQKENSEIYYTQIGLGEPLILVHGLMATGRIFDPIVPLLSKKYRLIIPDLRGHGKSQGMNTKFKNEQFSKDILVILKKENIEEFSVLGYSHGGAIAQILAFNQPNRVKNLVLVNSYSYKFQTLKEKIIARIVFLLILFFKTSSYEKLAKIIGSGGGEKLSQDQFVKFQSVVSENKNKKAMIETYKTIYPFDSRKWLSKIKCPTLIMRGAEDLAVPKHNAEMLKNGITNSELIEIPNAGHAMILSYSKEIAQEVINFLN
jgi:pimeloyl-ACP methyl ester carboxylesterase